jgi:predicted protein tyrosine phosphatase
VKILFVCGKNTVRSLTAEKLYQKTPGIQVRSAGTERSARVKVTAGDIGWADRIYAFEKSHLRELKERFGEALDGKELLVLHLSNPGGKYTLLDERLVAKIKEAVGELAC